VQFCAVAGDGAGWQPMLDLDPLFDVHSLSGLAATIEYDLVTNLLLIFLLIVDGSVYVLS